MFNIIYKSLNKLKLLIFKFLKIILGKYYYSFLLNLMHLKKTAFVGHSLKNNLIYINKIIDDINIETLLDFGCGKPILYNPNPYNKKNLDIYLYDPFNSKYKKLPTKKYDLIVCTDVMEHVQKENIKNVLTKMNSYVVKVIYFAICTRPAHKNLPDGQNAHITILNENEWAKIIRETISENIKVFIRFDENQDIVKI